MSEACVSAVLSQGAKLTTWTGQLVLVSLSTVVIPLCGRTFQCDSSDYTETTSMHAASALGGDPGLWVTCESRVRRKCTTASLINQASAGLTQQRGAGARQRRGRCYAARAEARAKLTPGNRFRVGFQGSRTGSHETQGPAASHPVLHRLHKVLHFVELALRLHRYRLSTDPITGCFTHSTEQTL